MSDRMNDVLAAIDAETAKCICGNEVPPDGASLDYCSPACQYGYSGTREAYRLGHGLPDGRTLNEQVARELERSEPIGEHYADAMRAEATSEPAVGRHWTAPDERAYNLVPDRPTTRVEWIGDLTVGTRETIDLTSQIRSVSVSTSGLTEATQRLAEALDRLGAEVAEGIDIRPLIPTEYVWEDEPGLGPVVGYEIRDGIDGPVVASSGRDAAATAASGDFPGRADVEHDAEARRRELMEPFLTRRQVRWQFPWPENPEPMSAEVFNRRLAELRAMGAILPIPPSLTANTAPVPSPQEPCRVYWGSHGCQLERGHRGQHRCEPGCPPIRGYEPYGEDSAPDMARRRALEHQQNRGTGPGRRDNRRWRNP